MATTIPSANELKSEALQIFAKEFGENANVCVCAPGRVNLIGEHTDYNEGFVLPMALPMVTVIAGKLSHAKKCKIISLSETVGSENQVEFEANCKSIKPGEPKWANYVKGCIGNFICDVPPFNAVIVSSVPVGAGLSSSAALEVATYTFLEALTGVQSKKPEDKALACQRAEHDFAGVPCGIMDQFISVMGQEGYALLLDCKDLSTKQIPMSQINDYAFLITNSNAPHKLSSSAYCKRRDSCYEAAKRLNKKSLREVSISDIQVLQSQNVSEEMIKRTRHVVTEIQRTIDAVVALEKGDFNIFGQLMNESHNSLKNDYEVSSDELDALVTAAREIKGVLGSRLTGAGFGGCTVTLLKKDIIDKTIKHIKAKYSGNATFYIASPAMGARVLDTN
ncbi:Galactokinase [Habropoda laboriosa]|uniref:Galactokinase n=1 Tax=Habropoda laboriosa TaxID=597456 RepID=A0A0L7R2T9_9HYME|nr:PREDICTED: galactokinase-like [Habropoda laboriosa]KOC65144.1 Galactokinase [Habropoda laboriosa]